jgi:hypothetical protein
MWVLLRFHWLKGSTIAVGSREMIFFYIVKSFFDSALINALCPIGGRNITWQWTHNFSVLTITIHQRISVFVPNSLRREGITRCSSHTLTDLDSSDRSLSASCGRLPNTRNTSAYFFSWLEGFQLSNLFRSESKSHNMSIVRIINRSTEHPCSRATFFIALDDVRMFSLRILTSLWSLWHHPLAFTHSRQSHCLSDHIPWQSHHVTWDDLPGMNCGIVEKGWQLWILVGSIE